MNTKSLLSLAAGIFLLCSCHTEPASREGETGAADSVVVKNEVVNTILLRRSIRRYKPQPVEKDKWAQMWNVGCMLPTGRDFNRGKYVLWTIPVCWLR